MSGGAYPTYDEIRRQRLAARRGAAIEALLRAQELARRAGGCLVVFGSLAEGGLHEHSNIDVALFGVPAGVDSDVAAEIDTLLTLAGFTADVIPERFLGPSLRGRIMRHGREPGALG